MTRDRTEHTDPTAPFDIVFGNIATLDGSALNCCTRILLRHAPARLRKAEVRTLAAFSPSEVCERYRTLY